MLIRDVVIQNTLTLGDSGTRIDDIFVTDPITEIELGFAATTGATTCLGNPLEECITKIEIVDGSDVLYSMPGVLADAKHTQETGKRGYNDDCSAPNYGVFCYIPIRFGRFYGDTLLALNPAAHRNLQIKVTYNLAAVTAVGATGYVSGTLRYTLIVRTMEDVPNPVGFLMQKDVYDFTSVGSGDRRIDMPIDWPYRQLLVRAYLPQTDITAVLTNFKLSMGGEKVIPFDLDVNEVLAKMFSHYPICERVRQIHFTTGVHRETYIGKCVSGQLTAVGSIPRIVSADYFWRSQVRLRVLTDAGAAPPSAIAFVATKGVCPHSTFFIPFGLLNDPDTWLNAPQGSPVRLYLSDGTAAATCNVAVEQYRRY